MIYTIIILVMLTAIVFFHYLEGLFSATLSAIFAVVAAVVAVGYHETIVTSLLGGRYAEESHALVLMILFAVTYLFLKLIFDQLIKGNVRVPVLVDKIGAAVMGLVVGIFALGVVTIAAEELPFGPRIAGYARYALLDDRTVPMHVSGYRNDQAPTISDELASEELGAFDASQKSKVFPPVDDAVVNTVSWLSGGSLAGAQPLTEIHPDLLQELFAQRLGMEPAANHSALNLPSGPKQVSVSDIYTIKSADVHVLDQYDPKLRAQKLTPEINAIQNLDKEKPDQMLLVIRTKISGDAADKDTWFRFAPGSIRLVAPQSNGEPIPPAGDYYPIGTLENNKLYVDKPDDYLFLNTGNDRVVDLVFQVDRWKPAGTMPSDAFMEVKRLARVDLAGKTIATEPPVPPAVGKQLVIGVAHVNSGESKAPEPPPAGRPATPVTPPATRPATPPTGTPQPPVSNGVLKVTEAAISADLPQPVGMTAAEAKKRRGSVVPGGTVDLRDGFLRSLALDGSETMMQLGTGDMTFTHLFVPKGQELFRIRGTPASADSWAWAKQLASLTLVDAGGTVYKARGVWAEFITNQPYVAASYSAEYDLGDFTIPTGTATDVFFYFPVPAGTQLKQITLAGNVIYSGGISNPAPAQPPQQPPAGNSLAPQSLVPGASAGVLDVQQVAVMSSLPELVGTTIAESKKPRGSVIAGGTMDLRDGKARGLSLDGSSGGADIEGTHIDIADRVRISDLSPPPGNVLIRITAKPSGDNSWGWASHLKTLTADDADGKSYAPQGVWADITVAGSGRIWAQYGAGFPLDNVTPTDGVVTQVYFWMAVPKGAVLKQLTLDGKPLKVLSDLNTSQ